MQRSVYLAKLIGPPFLVAGIGMLFNGAVYRAVAEQFLASPALIYLSGVIALPVGIAIVVAHDVWTRDWRVVITIFGWLAIVGGAVRMLAPQLAQHIGAGVIDQGYVLEVAGFVILTLGCMLSYCGFAELGAVKTAAAKVKSRRVARKRSGK